MFSLPLPFVVVLFLAFFLLSLILADKPWTLTRLAFAGLLGLGILHGSVTGLVWSYDLTWLRPALPILASLLPVATWLAFRSMAQSARRLHPTRIALHLIPTLVIVPLAFTGSLLIDPIIVASFVTHGVILWRMGAQGPDGFQKTLLHRALSASRAAMGAGVLLILNALVDISIIVDFQLTGGRHVLTILSAISVLILLLLAVVAATGINAASEDEPEEEDAPRPQLPAVTEDHKDTLRKVDTLMQDTRLYTDPDLTLIKIARKLGIPSREISTAINRHNGMNVSQYVNRLRLDEACRLLDTTDQSITEIHLDSGFQTKSNFNREFKRQFGCSPSQWRAGRRDKA
ncbi:helix-turn-helix domain-containing protein [Tropicibacter oceani]|uniref:AraC family transcriptional regulator n=1 Tax=Tropicibacter oceani TaxID=3058420 RepID=A0ABY8QIZ4_9RHOB|nr:AraC family transcriptional regulator [Tropicibacter oceani]WGW04509.1 AraC family transcriptional regulator [Tropicibacter oceani]